MTTNNESDEYNEIVQRHKKEMEEFENQFKSQIESANANLKKKLRQRYTKEKNALEERHYEELMPFKLDKLLNESYSNLNEEVAEIAVSKEDLAKQKKREKNKKKSASKIKKAEMMRKQVEEELEKDGGMTERQRELQVILNQLTPLELSVHEIQADGHCLYRAISHQIQYYNNEGNEFDYMKLRQLAAKYMREHKEDFIYFIDMENGDVMDDARYEEYCKKVENSSEWGGQVELRAIVNVLQRPIRIFQNGQLIVMGEEFLKEDNMLSISYHRNYYSLGEHYNSVIKKPQLEEQF